LAFQGKKTLFPDSFFHTILLQKALFPNKKKSAKSKETSFRQFSGYPPEKDGLDGFSVKIFQRIGRGYFMPTGCGHKYFLF
jgi:hypothetical protein